MKRYKSWFGLLRISVGVIVLEGAQFAPSVSVETRLPISGESRVRLIRMRDRIETNIRNYIFRLMTDSRVPRLTCRLLVDHSGIQPLIRTRENITGFIISWRRNYPCQRPKVMYEIEVV